MNVFNLNLIDNSGMFTSHFDSVFYPVTQVFAGKALLVDLPSLYGLYPHFLSPIFRITGLNVLNFTIVMATMIAFSYLFIFLFLSNVIRSALLRFLGFTTVIFLPYIFGKIITHDRYFQYHPIRIFPVCLSILLTMLYLKNRKRAVYYLSFLVSTLAVMWNFDSGIAVFLAWLGVVCYDEFFRDNLVQSLKKCLIHVILSTFSLLFVMTSFSLFVYIRNGSFPDYSQIFVFQKFYYLFGYFMMPMPIVHPWNIVVLIYLTGLSYSIICLLAKKIEYRSALVAFMSFLGVGLFVYYQGRSHNWNLLAVSYPAILLLVIYGEDLLCNIKKYGRQNPHNYFFFLLLSFSSFSLAENFPAIYEHINGGISSIFQKSSEISRNVAFIKKHVLPGEKIFILSGNESVYYAESGTVSPLNTINFRDVYFKEDYNKISRFLEDNNTKQVFLIKCFSYCQNITHYVG